QRDLAPPVILADEERQRRCHRTPDEHDGEHDAKRLDPGEAVCRAQDYEVEDPGRKPAREAEHAVDHGGVQDTPMDHDRDVRRRLSRPQPPRPATHFRGPPVAEKRRGRQEHGGDRDEERERVARTSGPRTDRVDVAEEQVDGDGPGGVREDRHQNRDPSQHASSGCFRGEFHCRERVRDARPYLQPPPGPGYGPTTLARRAVSPSRVHSGTPPARPPTRTLRLPRAVPSCRPTRAGAWITPAGAAPPGGTRRAGGPPRAL